MAKNTRQVTGSTQVMGEEGKAEIDRALTILMVGALPIDLNLVKGGVEAVIMNLFSGFKDLPHARVVHIAFTKEVATPKSVTYASNIVIHFLPFAVKYELADYAINRELLNSIIAEEQPDIIHIQEITPHIIRFLGARKDNIVVTQHGIMREELKYASGMGQKLKCLFKAAVERYVFPAFPNVIFISKYNQALYPGQPVYGQQIFNPVNPIFFDSQTPEHQEGNSIVYVGVLSRRKNIRIVIEALGEMKDKGKSFTLHVIGGFKDAGYQEEIHSLVKDLGLTDQVIFHGWMKQEQIREIYKGCPIFVLPSLQETLPVSIGEAMALGKVVVASDVGAIREMFTDKVSGFLFRKNNRQDLVAVLERLHNNTGLPVIGARARREAIEKFHPSTIVEKTIGFYRAVIEKNKAKLNR